MDIRGIDGVSSALIRELYGVTKVVDETIDESILRWFRHIERMGNNRTTNRLCVGKCVGSHLVGQP